MRKEILFIKNISREGPGLLEFVAKEKNIPYRIIDLSLGEEVHLSKSTGAVVMLGGPDSANDQTQKIIYELQLIRKVIKYGVPYLGICLGMQTLVKSAGGKVVKNQLKEVGLIDPDGLPFTVELTGKGLRDPLFSSLDNSLKVFQLHGETVELTNDFELLGTGKYCHNQIVKFGETAYGIQCHFELTKDLLELWTNDDDDLKKLDRDFVTSCFLQSENEYLKTGYKIFSNFLALAGF